MWSNENLDDCRLSGAALLAACAHAVDTAGAPSFGQAVEAAKAAQTDADAVDPTPPEGSGAQGALAQARYRNGQTTELAPSATSTTNSSTGPR